MLSDSHTNLHYYSSCLGVEQNANQTYSRTCGSFQGLNYQAVLAHVNNTYAGILYCSRSSSAHRLVCKTLFAAKFTAINVITTWASCTTLCGIVAYMRL